MAALEAAEEPQPNLWEELLRKMLPEGAPLPDENQLDYSISFDYVGPSPFFKPPFKPTIPVTKFTTYPKPPPSLTPRNPSWLKSRSSSDTTNSDNKRLSASSVAFDDVSDHYSINDGVIDAGDHSRCDRDSFHNGRTETKTGEKGRSCTRCGRGCSGLLRGREVCIVCGAVYCKKCVLKAMGSMPEGRKCVGCIGKAIDEANRGRLGKGSRLLARICSGLELKRIMQVERECKANRLRPEQVTLNGRQLREDELNKLLNCSLPPRDLRPGRYWYDKDTGLWGKEGEKPGKIISSKLDVGGKLQTDASRGNTKVYMNGREITKIELRVLKLAKVQCPRDTHFWLYEDGSYEEEGQNKIKGCIWEKASIRFLSSLFSLPVPPESPHYAKVDHASSSASLFPEYYEQQRAQKVLLLGLKGSGISTIFKQAKFLNSIKFTPEELQNIKLIIQSNTYRYLSNLVEAREHFEEEALLMKVCAGRSVSGGMGCDGSWQCIYSINQKINYSLDWLFDLMSPRDVASLSPCHAREGAPIINEIWKDPAIQETYKRREELKNIPQVAKYFLDRMVETSSNDYIPSKEDILWAEGVTPTNGIASIELSFHGHTETSKIYDQHLESQQPLSKYQLIHLSCNGCKWLEMFHGVSVVLFPVSLVDYDQLWTHSKGFQQNKMVASRDLFESVITHSSFDNTPFLLLLTKYDLFEDKISHVPLTVCDWFEGFNPLKTHSKNVSLAHQAFYYIAMKFKELYKSIIGRKLYVCQVQAHDQASVNGAFRYMREILNWEEHKNEGISAMSREDSVAGARSSLL